MDSLLDKCSEIAKEFDIDKNNISPSDISSGSPKRVWWKCDKDHSWATSVCNRTSQKTGCPYCKSKLPSKDNNLEVLYPEISKEWSINNDGNPEDYLPYSGKKVNWTCKYGHEWISIISNRTQQRNNCPICFKNESWSENYIFAVFKEIYDVTKHTNPEIDIYIKELNIGIEYDGYYHKFKTDVDNRKNIWASKNLNLLIRIRESYLPDLPIVDNVIVINQKDSGIKSCQGSIVQIFEILNINKDLINFNVSVESKIRNVDFPKELIDSWSKNNKSTIERAMKTHKYLWICGKCRSEYSSNLRNRIIKDCCPFCASQKVNNTNSLYYTHKNILKFISPENEIDPKTVTYGTGKKLKFILNSKEYNTTPRHFNRLLV